MSQTQRSHGKDDEDDELLELPTAGQLTHDVPTAPDPDVKPAGTEETPDPPGRAIADDLPR
ncbi:hypothetical protein VA596_29055 [Amycolatopsis sp., V23-08]|uniref:Uncharacterized protein n=1 Tax=Amycolatopsis heterodermiae TaxID=3110235 RepID=A0ABU5RBH8_9PSEU|nr:hypothetical protein [Amycolatopsis sp., V23-08]MEA5363613.1 hypothetical protein [Amycolatopsis sp., V23-08]